MFLFLNFFTQHYIWVLAVLILKKGRRHLSACGRVAIRTSLRSGLRNQPEEPDWGGDYIWRFTPTCPGEWCVWRRSKKRHRQGKASSADASTLPSHTYVSSSPGPELSCCGRARFWRRAKTHKQGHVRREDNVVVAAGHALGVHEEEATRRRVLWAPHGLSHEKPYTWSKSARAPGCVSVAKLRLEHALQPSPALRRALQSDPAPRLALQSATPSPEKK